MKSLLLLLEWLIIGQTFHHTKGNKYVDRVGTLRVINDDSVILDYHGMTSIVSAYITMDYFLANYELVTQ